MQGEELIRSGRGLVVAPKKLTEVPETLKEILLVTGQGPHEL